jgi:hypothetical protein
MVDIQSLRKRYVALNGERPAQEILISKIVTELGLTLPHDFLEISRFFDGSGINVLPLFSLSGTSPKLNPVNETLRLRQAVNLPVQWLVLGEPPESLLLMDCASDGRVIWIDAIDVGRIIDEDFKGEPTTWNSFSDFFEYLLDEEEEDR